MYKLRHTFDFGVIFCNTCFEPGSFEFMSDTDFIHDEYDEQVLSDLMNIQAEAIANGQNTHAFVIFDDAIDGEKQWNSSYLKKLCTQLRHYNITVIISTQHINAIPPRYRSNAMNIFMFGGGGRMQLESLFQSYGQQFDRYNDFKDYVIENTGDYRFIYHNRYEKSLPNPKDNFHVMKCPNKIPRFKIKFISNESSDDGDEY